MVKQIIVVEGIHDEMKVKEAFPTAKVIITNGREISNNTLQMIKKLSIDNQIIIFTDPDYPGNKIRSIIQEVAPNASHAFLKKSKCISKNKKKVGIEHASKRDIIESLSHVYVPCKYENNITISDLYRLKLTGSNCSSLLREKVSTGLNIGCPNTKTFLNRLNMFGITLDLLEAEVKKYEQ